MACINSTALFQLLSFAKKPKGSYSGLSRTGHLIGVMDAPTASPSASEFLLLMMGL